MIEIVVPVKLGLVPFTPSNKVLSVNKNSLIKLKNDKHQVKKNCTPEKNGEFPLKYQG